jgi:hypothetical protein
MLQSTINGNHHSQRRIGNKGFLITFVASFIFIVLGARYYITGYSNGLITMFFGLAILLRAADMYSGEKFPILSVLAGINAAIGLYFQAIYSHRFLFFYSFVIIVLIFMSIWYFYSKYVKNIG